MQFKGLGKRNKKNGVPNEIIDKVLGYEKEAIEKFF
jgi:hypothetical protein